MSNNSKKRSKAAWVIGTVIIIIIGTLAYNFDYVKALGSTFGGNHYKSGDNIYASDKLLNDKSSSAGILVVQIVKNQNSPYNFSFTDDFIDIKKDSLKKYHTNIIGTYLDYRLIPLTYKNKSSVLRFLAIKPDWRLIDSSHHSIRIKPGYQLVDDNYYVLGTSSFIKQ